MEINQIQLNSMKINDKQSTTKWSRGQPEVQWQLVATVGSLCVKLLASNVTGVVPVLSLPIPLSVGASVADIPSRYFVSTYRPQNRALIFFC